MDWVFFSYHLSWFQRDITLGPEQQDFQCTAIRNTVSVPTFWYVKCDTLTKQKHAQEWKQKIDPHYFELRYDFMQAYIFPVHQCSVCTFSEAILCHEASL